MRELARDHDMHQCTVLAAVGVLELRRQNDLYVDNGEVFDEQIGGIGRLLQQIIEVLSGDLAEIARHGIRSVAAHGSRSNSAAKPPGNPAV